jgi:hypothetical protein
LNLDQYLSNFPGGKNLSLEVCGISLMLSCLSRVLVTSLIKYISSFTFYAQFFAEKVGATNFECGIGKMCNANQVRMIRCD